jgi:hypothetical protein
MREKTVFLLSLFTILILLSSTVSAFSFSDLIDSILSLFGLGKEEKQTTTTLKPKVVCNPPYIKIGNKCCLDKNSNKICDKDEKTTTTRPPATTTPAAATYGKCENGRCVVKEGKGKSECSTDKDCVHNECVNGYCKEVVGPGQDKCSRDKDCRHNECVNKKCIEQMSPGTSTCQIDSQCVEQVYHKGCLDGICKDLKGEGQDECSTNSHCRHKECVHTPGMPSKCETVMSPGDDTCTDDFSCFEAMVGHCQSGQCRFDIDTGPECTKSSECYHNICKNDQCITSLTPGTDECDTDLDCVEWEYHYECQDGACVKVDGAGSNECEAMDAQCKHMECQGDQCVEVLTPGDSTCNENADCGGAPTTTVKASTTTLKMTTTTQKGGGIQCGGDLYNEKDCKKECDTSCETCVQYEDWPCYYCRKDCSKLGKGWGDMTKCSSCDLQHEDCVEHATCDGCYHCVVECPEDTDGVDYYRFPGCDAKCESSLCRQVKLAQPQSKYKECYRCYDPVCGDGIVSWPDEECETDADCPKYHKCHPLDCLCDTDCNAFCAAQPHTGDGRPFTLAATGKTNVQCSDKNDPTSVLATAINALKEQCYAVCGRAYFLDGMSDSCCCIKTDKQKCLNCPCTFGVNCPPDCNTPMNTCKANIPM